MSAHASPAPAEDTENALRIPAFAAFWAAAFVSNTGAWVSNIAVPFVIFSITGSAWWVGLVAVASFVPGVFMGIIGGVLADRIDRRRVLIVTQSIQAVAAIGLWAVWAAGVRDPGVLMIPVAVSGAAQGLNMPSWQAFVHDLVPRSALRSAVALQSLQLNLARALGPVIAGGLLATLGAGAAFLINAASFVVVIGVLIVVRALHPYIPPATHENAARQLWEAGSMMLRDRGIALLLVLSALVGVFANPIFTFTVVLADDVFRVDALGLGLLNAALGLGAVLAAPIASGRISSLPLSTTVLCGLIGFGGAMVALGVTTSYGVALILLTIAGACFLFMIVGINTSLQMLLPSRLRGRGIAIRSSVYIAGFPIGAMLSGALSEQYGVGVAVIVLGGALLVSAAALWLPGRGSMLARLNLAGKPAPPAPDL
ncbi:MULTISPECIES: MFS transporter [unclassified Salinibacterium]|uniref:MFS transporter n=1 Tax=unclassified Salinibacterium TaxID=2632331 RepID=UPI00141FAF21|nr:MULTISPECIES: MFS transporter [unclassified Salinibacterium]